MSSALPCGIPSAMSNRTTSPSSLRPTRWASVPPIWPAPINAILGRAMCEKTFRFERLDGTMGGNAAHRPFRGRHSRRRLNTLNTSAPLPNLARLAGLRLLHGFKLDLLDFRQPLPLSRQHVVHLFVQMTNLE